MARSLPKLIALGLAASALAGCSAVTRIEEIGDPPALATIAELFRRDSPSPRPSPREERGEGARERA